MEIVDQTMKKVMCQLGCVCVGGGGGDRLLLLLRGREEAHEHIRRYYKSDTRVGTAPGRMGVLAKLTDLWTLWGSYFGRR
jgi:hypothetical protein